MTQRTYYEDDGPVWEWWSSPEIEPDQDPYSVEVRAGFTMRDLHTATNIAMSRNVGWRCLGHADRYQAAWDGAITVLYSDPPPEKITDLVIGGLQGLTSATRAQLRHHGVSTVDRSRVGPRFATYWTVATDTAEERLVEAVALAQVWLALEETDRDTLAAKALIPHQAQASEALGVRPQTFSKRLKRARKNALELLFGEEPAPLHLLSDTSRKHHRDKATHCGRGHEWTPDNTQWSRSSRPGGAKQRLCRACKKFRAARAVE